MLILLKHGDIILWKRGAAIMFVLGNINSNKVNGHRDLPPEKIFSTAVFRRAFGCVIT